MASANQATRRFGIAPNVLLNLAPVHVDFTPRELLVLAEVVEGLSSKEIARALDLSPRTIEFHRANLRRKCGAKNTADLVRKVLSD